MSRAGTISPQATGGQQKSKGQSGGIGAVGFRLDLTQAGNIQPTIWQPAIDLRSTKSPMKSNRAIHGGRVFPTLNPRGVVCPLTSFESHELGAQPSQLPLPPPLGWGIEPLRGRRG